MIRLLVVGQSSIELDGKRLTTESEIVFGMLLYLAVRAGDVVQRDEAQALFWPDLSHTRGRHCLRQALYRLRQLGVPLRTDNGWISIALGDVTSDYAALTGEDISGCAYRDLAIADLLPAYQPTFSIPFSAWVEEFRSRLGLRIRQGLVRTIIDLRSKGRYREAEPLARACLTSDPLNEVATLTLAEATAVLSGNRAEAMTILDRYIDEIGGSSDKRLALSASVLRRRISERFIEQKYSAPPEPPFVGREDLLQLLVESMQQAVAGRSTVVYVWGEAGIGKTRLLQEFSKVASVQGVRVQQYTVTPNDPGRPLSLFSVLLPRLLLLPGALGIPQDDYAAIERFVDPSASGKVDPPGNATESTQVFSRLKSAVAELIEAIAEERPLAVLVDDLHWIDSRSLEVLSHLVEQVRNKRVTFILTSRDAVSAHGRNQTDALCIRGAYRRLDGLATAEIEWLLDRIAAQRNFALTPEFVRQTVSTSAGNPLFVSELATHYGWNGVRDDLPASMQTLLQKRLDALSASALLVFQTCAVLGEQSTVERAWRTLGSSMTAIAGDLQELEHAGLVVSAQDGVLCRHQLIAREALKKLTSSVARALHAGAANVLRAELTSHLKLTVAQACLGHFAAAHQATLGVRLAIDVARRLIDVGVPNDALALLDATLTLQPGAQDRSEILASRLFAARAAGEWPEVSRTLAEIDSVRLPMDMWEDGEFRRIAFDAHKFSGHSIGHEIAYQLALLKRGDLGAAATKKVAVNVIIACADDFDSETARSVFATYFRESDWTQGSLEDLMGSLVYETSFGSLNRGIDVAQRIANHCSLAPISGHRQAQLIRWCARPFHLVGDRFQAQSLLATARNLASERGQPGEVYECAVQNLQNALDLEDTASSRRWLERLEALPNGSESVYSHATLLLVRFREALLRTDVETVGRCMCEFDRCRLPDSTRVHVVLGACRLWASTLQGKPPLEGDVDRVLRLSPSALESHDMDWILCALCAVARERGRHEPVRELVTRYLSVRRPRFQVPRLLREFNASVA